MLAVKSYDIALAEQGWSISIPGAGALAGVMGDEFVVRRIPVRDGRVQLTADLDCAIAPMIGCIGWPPSTATGRP